MYITIQTKSDFDGCKQKAALQTSLFKKLLPKKLFSFKKIHSKMLILDSNGDYKRMFYNFNL